MAPLARSVRSVQQVLTCLGIAALTLGSPCAGGPSLTVPSTVPSNASDVVDPDFPGFAFEEASFVEYAQDSDGNPNTFSQNLIAAITNRTGGKPLIRLGGTSADYAHYLPGQATPALPVAEVTNYQDVGGTTIGPSYWDLGANFPDALYIVQVPLANTNISEAIAWTQSAIARIGADKIYAIEPGNEADLYPASGLGPPTYLGKLTNATYVGNFTKVANAIASAVPLLPSGRIFQAFDTSVHLGTSEDADAWVFDIPTVFTLGIDSLTDNRISAVAHHYYQTNGGTATTLSTGLMQHSAIAGHLDLFRPGITWLKANHPNIPFVLSEIGNSLNPTHNYAYQATLGSALWQVDFQLYALATVGVARFNFQQIMHSGFDLWLPVASGGMAPQVFANFYAQPFVADFVGNPSARLAALDIAGENTGNVAAYAAFVAGTPERVALVNLNYWNASSSAGTRGSQTVQVTVPSGVASVLVQRLTSPDGAGAGADSITYADSRWTYESGGLEVKGVSDDSLTLTVESGVVAVKIYQSEALLLHLQS